MFAWLPIIGPILDAIIKPIVELFIKKEDTKVERIHAQTIDNQTAAGVTVAFKDDVGSQVVRDLIMFPVGVWTALFVWDKIVMFQYPNLVWGVGPMTEASGLAFLPYAVMTFLFGMALIKR